MKNVFLAGPMRGFAQGEARARVLQWRQEIAECLGESFTVRHAFRGRESHETFPDPKGAVIRDKQDIINADIIIVNDSFPGASMIGTSMEILLAFQHDKPIIAFGDAHAGDYWMDYHITLRVKTQEDACKICKELFNE